MKLKEESVWDYPRPPRLESFSGHIRIIHLGIVLADSNRVYRILETSHPPSYYIPKADINSEYFVLNKRRSFCEWKGEANYIDLIIKGKEIKDVGWMYSDPNKKYSELKNTISFYAGKFDDCLVNNEKVQAQEGDFYGGWITSNIKGPFKGAPGTWGW